MSSSHLSPASPWALSLAGALVLASALVACNRTPDSAEPPADGPRICTMIGCFDGLRVELGPRGGWPAGAYTFALVIDGAPVTCAGSLPLPACGTPAITCDREGAPQIGESGCALPPAQQSFSEVFFEGTPSAVELTIRRDGVPVLATALEPTYTEHQPNGDGCPPVCRSATASLDLDLTSPAPAP